MEKFEPVAFTDIRVQDRIRYLSITPTSDGSFWRAGRVLSITPNGWITVITDQGMRGLIHRDSWAIRTPQRAVGSQP